MGDENLIRVENKNFKNEDVDVDGKYFYRCSFDDCALCFSGGDIPMFDSCRFAGNPRFDLGDAAARTLQMIRVLAGSFFYGPEVRAVLEDIIRERPIEGGTTAH